MPGRATPTSSAASPTPTARSATPRGCASSSSRSAARRAAPRALPRPRRRSSPRSAAVVADAAFEGEPVDYVDGVVFSATESYLVLGRRSDEPGPTSDYTGRDIYYRSIQHDDPAPRRDRLTHPRLPVALGHRLVLVLPGVRCPEPRGARGLAQALAAQQRLLEADRPRPALRRRRPARGPQGPATARAGGAGRRDPAGAHCRVPAAGSCARCPSSRSGCARCGFAATQPWSLYPLQPGRDLRQRRLLVVRAHPTRAPGRAPPTGASSTRSPPWGATSRSTPSRSTTRRSSAGSTAAAQYTALKQRWDPDGRLPDLYAKAVRGA